MDTCDNGRSTRNTKSSGRPISSSMMRSHSRQQSTRHTNTSQWRHEGPKNSSQKTCRGLVRSSTNAQNPRNRSLVLPQCHHYENARTPADSHVVHPPRMPPNLPPHPKDCTANLWHTTQPSQKTPPRPYLRQGMRATRPLHSSNSAPSIGHSPPRPQGHSHT